MYKKGQLTLWVLLAVADGKKYADEIADFISGATAGHLTVAEQSLYRALRRFRSMGLVAITEEPSPNGGPNRKYYLLTGDGFAVLQKFINLHLAPLQAPRIQQLINWVNQGENL